jgi:sigma-B regulation protein RsbU (phosphoserine phosphatase)
MLWSGTEQAKLWSGTGTTQTAPIVAPGLDSAMSPRKGSSPSDAPGLGRVFLDDLRTARLRGNIQELKALYLFYLDEETRAKLEGMGRLRRAFSLLGWLLKSLLLKLSPGRRLALLIALVFGILGWTRFDIGAAFRFDFRPWGFVILLVVLMLELKDKLLAKDEIQVARKVQLALLPHENPEIPGWSVWGASRPANDVGGDLVDYVELDGFRHGVALGDVAGKGLGAALLSAKLQATLRALIPQAPSLDELGLRVNTILHRDGLDNRYATLFYAELEHDSGQVRYLNAGHNPALLIRKDGVERLSASSYPLGMLPGASYEESTVYVEPGDVIVAYSDGLTEAQNTAGEEFGPDRVEALLPTLKEHSPDDIGSGILAEVDRFLGGARASDDLSLVVVVRK